MRLSNRILPTILLLSVLCLSGNMQTVYAQATPLQQADAAYKSGDLQTALKLTAEAEKADPNNPDVYQAKGSILRKMGDKSDAKAAWEHLVQLDPNLSTIHNKSGFRKAFTQVGGTLPATSTAGNGTASDGGSLSYANPIMISLTNGDVYLSPSLQNTVDTSRLMAAASPTKKLVVTDTLYPYTDAITMANAIRNALNLGDGVVIVLTPKRIGASSGHYSTSQINALLKNGNLNQALVRGGLTEAAIAAANAFPNNVSSAPSGNPSSVSASPIRSADTGINPLALGVLGLGGLGGIFAFNNWRKQKALADVKEPLERSRRSVLESLTYVDGYLDLLNKDEAAERARMLRASAYEKYATASALTKDAKTIESVEPARPLLEAALSELNDCRKQIDIATGGTGVAMQVPTLPSLATDSERAALHLKSLEEIRSQSERDEQLRLLNSIPKEQRGVSFFSGRPMASAELVPVTIVVGGRKQTVMASRDEASEIQRGHLPQVRAFEENGRYIPWYEYRGYDPYRDYYGYWDRGPVGTLVDFYILSELFGGGLWGGYGGWGYSGYGWGMGQVYGNPAFGNVYGVGAYDTGYYGGGYAENTPVQMDNGGQFVDVPSNSGGMDFFGQQGYDDTSNRSMDSGVDFGSSSDSGSDSGGGFDFGGGDFGGGGSDFGGGGDFGGGDS